MLDRIVLDQPQAGLFPRLTLAEIKVGQGRFADAERLLAQVHDAGGAVVQPQFVGSRYACAAEMALWQRQTDAVREAVMEGLHALGEVDSPLVPLRLCALGLRSEADESLRLAALPRTARTDLRERSSTLEEIAARVGTLASTVEITETTEAAVLVDLCRAERARAEGSDNPADWNRIAERWRMLKRSYAMAYALWRAAESAARHAKSARSVGQNAGQAWRKRAGVVVREAHDIGRQVGAIPLCGAVEEWARDARFNLTDVGPPRTAPAARSSPDSVGLTKRELEVLALVTAGWTNRKIAVKLYITEKTAGVHVSNILRKLGVAKRGEAADRAKHLGLGA
jgi:ATP/maltotriose-dependent transcriptional regulator MalT